MIEGYRPAFFAHLFNPDHPNILMNWNWLSFLQVNLATEQQQAELIETGRQRRWGLSLILVGWLHLLAFGSCYYLTIALNYHEAPAYLSIWFSELFLMGLIFRLCGGKRPASLPVRPLENVIRRVWIAYFILAFNLASMNTLRGHFLFELFPAMASLASFAFLMMTILIHWRFFGAVLVMFGAGLLMAAFLWHAFLIFALAWWLVLNVIGLYLLGIPACGQSTEELPESINNDHILSQNYQSALATALPVRSNRT